MRLGSPFLTLIAEPSAQLAHRARGAGPGSARAAKAPGEAGKQGKAWKHEAGPGGLSPRLLLQSLPASVWTSLQDSTGEVLQAMTSAEGCGPLPQPRLYVSSRYTLVYSCINLLVTRLLCCCLVASSSGDLDMVGGWWWEAGKSVQRWES